MAAKKQNQTQDTTSGMSGGSPSLNSSLSSWERVILDRGASRCLEKPFHDHFDHDEDDLVK